jgi:hypothetical protein
MKSQRLFAHMNLRRLLPSLVMGLSLLGGCAADHVDSTRSPVSHAGGGTQGDPGTEGDGCAGILDEDCNPAGKHYTPTEVSACEAARQQSYDQCIAVAACQAAQDKAVIACGPKPPESATTRPAYDACVGAAQAAFNTCVSGSGTGTQP